MSVYQKIYNVMSELGWIDKGSEVVIGGKKAYDYVSEAQFIAEVRPLMTKHKLVVIPTGVPHMSTQSKTDSNGKVTYLTDLVITYRFADVESGDYVDVAMAGQGSDTNDKGVYKAETGAFKYLIRQAFMVGTGIDPEATDSDGNIVSVPKPINHLDTVKKFYTACGLDFDKLNLGEQFAAKGINLNAVTTEQAKAMSQVAKAVKDGAKLDDVLAKFKV